MNEAIKLAMEKGGYQPNFVINYWRPVAAMFADPLHSLDYPLECIFTDSLFWQALGKALGWDAYKIVSFNSPARTVRRVNPNITYSVPAHIVKRRQYSKDLWKKRAHQYFDLVLTGGDTEAFWRELLKPNDNV